MGITSFTQLNAWKESHRLVIEIYRVTKNFPKEELFGLTNQIRRAVVSITSNIAEGFARRTSKDKQQFYYISIGSVAEVQNQILVARDLKYIDNSDFKLIADQTVTVNKLISGLLKTSMDK